MKLKSTVKNKNKLLKLKLIKTKIYKKNYSFANLKIEDIEYRLKKGLEIIYKYHVNGKKILFVSSSSAIEIAIKNLLKNTKHIFMPDYLWLNGTIINKQPLFSKSQEKNLRETTLKFKKNNNLTVILDKEIKNHIITESFKTKTPVIFLGNSLNIFDIKSNYKIPGNFLLAKKKIRDNFFLALLENTLKKAVFHRKLNQRLIRNRQKFKPHRKNSKKIIKK
jgi:ribosomal protein S2